ncbi:MAG: translocation/assembly module TamB domain-containing protein [Rhodobacterales bacterium]|nr:translocation/assembly module TamB domain-containing protein [Rhodobacterales bacterium]
MSTAIIARAVQITLMALFMALPLKAAAQDDRGLLQGFIEDNLSTEGRSVRIEGFRGALSSKASLDLLTIADEDGVWLTLKDVTLDWSRLALLRGRFQVSELSAGEILVPRLPKPQESVELPDAEATGFSLPDLPVAVNIDRVAAQKIVLGAPLLGEEVSLSLTGSLKLDDGVGDAKLDVTRLDRDSDKVVLDVGYSNADHRLAIDLTAVEAAGGLLATRMGIPGAPSILLKVAGDAPLEDFSADISLDTDGERRIGGTVAVQTPAPDPDAPDTGRPLTFAADIGGDIAPVFAPEYRAFFGREITLVVRGSKPAGGGLGIDVLSLKSAALTLDGTLQLDADNWPSSFDLTGRVASQDGSPVLLPLSGPKTTLDNLDLKLGYDRATGDAWRLSLDGQGVVRDELTLDSAQVVGGGTLIPRKGDAAGHVDGALDIVASGLELADPDLKTALGDALSGAVAFDWTQGSPFHLTSLALKGQDFNVDGSADITGLSKPISPRVSASVTVKASDLARFAGIAGTDLQGGADVKIDADAAPFDGSLKVSVRGAAQDLAIGQPRLDPLLAGRTELEVDARRGTDGTFLDRLRVTSPATDLTASAALKSNDSTADLALKVADAALIAPGLAGPATLDVDADQEGTVWKIKAGATGPGKAVVTADGTVDMAAGKPGLFDATASIVASDLSRYANLIGRDLGGAASVLVDARGNVSELSGEAEVQVTGQNLSVGIDAADRILRGASSASIDAQRSADGALTLSKAVLKTPQIDASGKGFYGSDGAGQGSVDITGNNLTTGIAQADALLRGRSSLSADVTRSADGALTIERADLETPQIAADMSGTIGTHGDASAKFDARLANVALLAPGIPGPATAKGTIRGDGTGFVIDTDATGPAGIAAKVAGRIGKDGTLALTARGKAPLALANFAISPRSLSGVADFDLAVNGPPAISSVTGTVSTNGAGLALPKLRLALQDIDADIRLSGGAAQLAIGAGVSSGGRLALDGSIGLDAPFQANLTTELQEVGLSDPGLYATTANGRVTLIGPATGGANIAGTIALGEVNVQVPSGAISAGAKLPGLEHINEPKDVRRTRAFAGLLDEKGAGEAGAGASGPSYGLDLSIDAPARIFIRGRGLDAELGGALHLRGTTQQVIPEGQFDLLRGRLDILGKRLDLTEGYLQMQGSFVPYLHLVAQAESGDVQVFITIDGPANEPEITFSSQPDLPEDQIVSQLIFGRDLSQISAFQAIQLASAVATLAGKGGGGVVDNLRKGVGLDNLDVTTGEGDTTEVKAGKYLSDNIYSEVEVDSDGETQINLNLQINKRLKAKGSFAASGDSGIGVFFEKDY